ncbi:MAG: rRNA pseudouridine synthase [Bacilli bacterium]|nr:rRNA pseudouridine synthase [Bacilli bacterium]
MERLQKVIANNGYCSRREAEKLILDNRVSVNGKIINELGIKVSEKDLIEIDGVKLAKDPKEYYLLYKPRGVVSTSKDDKNRKTVVDIIKTDARIYPVGRLDYDTTGVLLLTNDGELSNLLTHPKNKVDKIYIAKVKGIIDVGAIKKLENGVMIDGYKTSKARVKLKKVDKKTNTCIVQLTIHEGRNHQVKKMFESVGFEVLKLKREVFAFFTTGTLKSGEYRKLTIKEVKQLYGMFK